VARANPSPLPNGAAVFRISATLMYLLLVGSYLTNLIFAARTSACCAYSWPVLVLLGIPVALSWCRLGMTPIGYCGGCGYPLPNATNGTCPECGNDN
jgi:hypothetical protein